MKLETVTCGHCGSSESDWLYEAENSRLRLTDVKFNLRRCRHCDLIYTSPRPCSEEMGPFYSNQYYHPNPRIWDGWINRYFARERISFVRSVQPRGSLLDVGCGAGEFLKTAMPHFDVQGIEPSSGAFEAMPSELNGRIRQGTLEKAGFEENSFDMVTLWHVLEHLPAPLETLKVTRNLLKPGGSLIVEVPNAGSAEARLLGPYWFALDVPRHYWHFAPETLCALAEKAGFSKISIHASAWKHPSLALTFMLSNGDSIQLWSRKRFGKFTGFKPVATIIKILGIPLFLLMRFSYSSPPTIRLVAYK